jgi:hypothetical protein
LAQFSAGGAVVAANGDEETLEIVAVHLDQPIAVRRSAVDDDEGEVVVLLDLGPVVDVFGVLDASG